MAINLASKYSDKIASVFTAGSFVAGKTSTEWDFSGVKSVKIYTPQTVDPVDYTRSGANRYGTPTEMTDTVQELIMTQDKGFSMTIDKGNNEEQLMIKNAGKMMKLETDEKIVPMADKYAIKQYVQYAGKVGSIALKPTKTTIVDAINDGCTVLDDASVPSENRYIYITGETYKVLRVAPEFLSLEQLGAKALAKGIVGEIFDCKVVKVPTSYLPTNCYFLIAHKNSVIMPYKIKDAKVHQDPPGISGALLEGRNLWDAFVIGARSAGVYACVLASTLLADPTITLSGANATCASAGATKIWYTIDGTDPRYSETRELYASAVTLEDGQTIKAYAADTADKFPSGVSSKTYTAG